VPESKDTGQIYSALRHSGEKFAARNLKGDPQRRDEGDMWAKTYPAIPTRAFIRLLWYNTIFAEKMYCSFVVLRMRVDVQSEPGLRPASAPQPRRP
jgi:hypothetical protein